jgi:hypothetical protein
VPLFEMTREDLAECKPVAFTHLEIKERAGLRMSCAITSKYLVTRILLGLARRPGVAGGAVTAAPAGRAARWVAAGAALTTLAALGYLITISPRARVRAGKHIPAWPRPTRIAFGVTGHLILAI